jgi:hypothetical protein
VRKAIACPPVVPPPGDESFPLVFEARRSERVMVPAPLARRQLYLPHSDN